MRLLRYNILNSLLARSAVVGSNILYLNSNHTVAPISVSVAAVNFGVDRTIIVSKSVDPILAAGRTGVGGRLVPRLDRHIRSSRRPNSFFSEASAPFKALTKFPQNLAFEVRGICWV